MQVHVMLEPDRTPDQIADLAILAESVGIRALWSQNYTSGRDAFLSLVPAAAATRSIILGVAVVSPYELHPVKLANQLFTLNEYCGGRAALVVGGGGEWLTSLGLKPSRRVRAVRECLEIIRKASSQDMLNYDGEVYTARRYQPRYASDTAPPVYTGANRRQMLRVTAPVADGVMMSDMPRPLIGEAVRLVRTALEISERAGDDYRVNNIWAWHVKADRDAAIGEARRELLLRGLLDRWYLESFLSEEDCMLVEKNKAAFYKAYQRRSSAIDGVPDRIVNLLLDNLTFTGAVDELESKLHELDAFARAGVGEMTFRLHDEPDAAVRLIGERIVPIFDR